MPSPVFQYLIEDDSISEINSLFQVLFNYWDVCSKRYREYTFLQVEFITFDFYQLLYNYWQRKNWDIKEWSTICSAMDVQCPCLNPHYFTDQKLAYIEHIKTCFFIEWNLIFLEKNGVNFSWSWIFSNVIFWEARLFVRSYLYIQRRINLYIKWSQLILQ